MLSCFGVQGQNQGGQNQDQNAQRDQDRDRVGQQQGGNRDQDVGRDKMGQQQGQDDDAMEEDRVTQRNPAQTGDKQR